MASQEKPHVKELSSKIKDMKFMSRIKEESLRVQLEEEIQKATSEAQWVVDFGDLDVISRSVTVEHDPSFLSFTTYSTMGRQSFNNFNPNIEKLSSTKPEIYETPASVSDEQMAKSLRKRKHNSTNGDSLSNSNNSSITKSASIVSNTADREFMDPTVRLNREADDDGEESEEEKPTREQTPKRKRRPRAEMADQRSPGKSRDEFMSTDDVPMKEYNEFEKKHAVKSNGRKSRGLISNGENKIKPKRKVF
ncbi:M-phase phosphoprotein 6 [Nowakowskiella sp. JEL0407]|nr:M-phase phosphoprotein 6 [Nowakowskiella sp. JEL0407]